MLPFVGQRMKFRKRTGTVRFVGEAKFAKDTWVGIELDEEKGKHNGSVQGENYFLAQG